MIPHMHDDERQRGEQAPNPLPQEERTSPPAPWWRSKNLLQRVIGVLVLFGVGLAAPTSDTANGFNTWSVLLSRRSHLLPPHPYKTVTNAENERVDF